MPENIVYDYNCLMANFQLPWWEHLITNFIEPNDIYWGKTDDFGLETNPHVTVLYGFHENTAIAKVKAFCYPLNNIKVHLKNVSIFNVKNDNEEYAVVKFDCESPTLMNLNNVMTENFEYTSEFTYHPHITIGYVKPKCANKYIRTLTEEYTLIPAY